MISEQTIAQFFKGQCTAAEAAAVEAYLQLHPEKLEQYIGLLEFEQFQPARMLDTDLSHAAWSRIAAETMPASRRIPLYWKRIAAAASIALIIALGWYFAGVRSSSSVKESPLAISVMKEVKNTSTEKMLVYLGDSSVVELMPGSGLSYPEAFDPAERKVMLHGEALFAVAKQPHRPFKVVADSLITEVLGTQFTVRSYEKEDRITVALHEGKVQVRPAGLPFAGDMQLYKLLPGDELSFDKRIRTVRINHPQPVNPPPSAVAKATAPLRQKGVAGNNWYMFHNQSLPEVLQQLSRIYRTPIYYSKKELQGLSFIGKIDRTDSLENVLRAIALLNELQLHKQDSGYQLKK